MTTEGAGKILAPMVMGMGGLIVAGVLYNGLFATVSGIVYDDFGNGIEGVIVGLNGSSVTTGSDGIYAFRTLAGSHTISFSKDGYYTVTRTLSVGMGADVAFNVPMKQTVIDPTGTLLCAPLTEGAGSAVMDLSPYANNGLLGGGEGPLMPVWTTLPNGKRCLSFGGVNDFVDFGDIGIPAGGPASIAGWFQFADTAKTRSMHMDLYGGFLYQHAANDLLYIEGTADLFRLLKAGPGQVHPYVLSFAVGQLYYLVLTYDGDTSSAILYVNKVAYGITQQADVHTIPAFPGLLGGRTKYAYSFSGLIGGALRGV